MNTPDTSPESDSKQRHVSNLLENEDNLIDQIQHTLSCLGYAQLNSVRCIANGDEVTLTGQLDSFYLKQVAQSVAIKVPGVRNVRNEIQVR
jgi:osmotically-inducible protein OsmY